MNNEPACEYHCTRRSFSRKGIEWNLSHDGSVGGHFPCPNLSGGFHGLEQQWWEFYGKGKKVVLLVSENKKTKKVFQDKYPDWNVVCVDLDGDCDLVVDVAKQPNPFKRSMFDVIINQAMLEHCYNPFQAMMNLSGALKPGGVLITHTHPPPIPYHAYPRDYMRFMIDWWYDLPRYIHGILLEEFLLLGDHVFSC